MTVDKLVKAEILQEEDTQKNRFLTFVLGNEAYGIEIKYVTEIICIQPITEIPQQPQYIKGIINLRGQIIPVMDIRLRFKRPYMDYNDRTCIVVVNINTISIGLIVDSVSEVITLNDGDIVDPPELNKEGNKFIKCIGKTGNDVKLILDCDKVLNDIELTEAN